MRLSISHTTTYRYEDPVHYALQRVRLRPVDSPLQTVRDWSLKVEGGRFEVRYADHFGNDTDLVSVDPGAREVTVTASGTVETRDAAGILGKVPSPMPLWFYLRETALTRAGSGLRALAGELEGATAETHLDALHALSAQIADQVAYGPGDTYVGTTAEEALAGGRGVCQDHAQIFIAAARQAGIPARYVSGYLMLDDREDQDASHAWAEAWIELLGWVGFDVSNRQCPDERYVRLAIGRDYRDAAPIGGLRLGPGGESMIVSVQVQQ